MQFTGSRGLVLFVTVVVLSCAVGFGSGWLVGRQYPTHSFQRFGESRYVLDLTTGRVCDPFKDPNSPPGAGVPDLTDLFGSKPAPPTLPPGFVLDEKQPDYPPACGK
jgi:hypothetical protein